MSREPGVSSSESGLVPVWGRMLDWALTFGFRHDRRMANAASCDRLWSGTDRRLSRRINVVEEFPETAWSSPARSTSFTSSTAF